MKYAFGEIVLVVIGILIALSINNWNEERKNNILVGTYKIGLIENLKKDSLNITSSLNKINEDLKNLDEFEMRISNSNHPFDTIVKIARYEFDFKLAILYNFENDTYETLNSTGHISLFGNDLSKELNELYNLQKKALYGVDKTSGIYSTVVLKYSEKYPFAIRNNLTINGTVASKQIWNNISQTKHATEFNALVIAKSDCYDFEMFTLPQILEKTNQLLIKLQAE